MKIKDQMDEIYRDIPQEKIPWLLDNPPEILKSMVQNGKLKPCNVIELGCGIGNYVIFFASKGFKATGVDISSKAIDLAIKSAKDKNIKCNFFTANVLGEMSEINSTYDFAYDWELMHHIFPKDRKKYINNVHRLLNSNGRYLSICFSEESSQFGGVGKYRITPLNTELYFSSESEMVELFKPLFDIEELKTVTIEGKYVPNKAIYALLKKNS